MGGPKTRNPSPARGAPAASPLVSAIIPRMWDDEPEPSTTNETGAVSTKALRPFRRPALMVVAGSSAGRVFPIEAQKVTVGRSKQAVFTLNDQGISRMHCGIARTGAAYFVSDLGSTNGTFVNGNRAEKGVRLEPGDRIQIGPETVLQFDFYDEAEDGLVKKLYEAATRDLLTGALNRRAFDDRLTSEVAYAVRHRAKLVVFALDIDDFKVIHDTYGNDASDAVLTEVAGAIASTLRSEDVFARTSGEKFLVLARGLTLRKGAKMAGRIRKLLDERDFEIGVEHFRITLSAGVAELAETKSSASGAALLQLACQRLAAATDAGRNRVAHQLGGRRRCS